MEDTTTTTATTPEVGSSNTATDKVAEILKKLSTDTIIEVLRKLGASDATLEELAEQIKTDAKPDATVTKTVSVEVDKKDTNEDKANALLPGFKSV